jgi:DNA helicase HerA-like ATPase
MQSQMETAASQVVGTVESVSPREIVVRLEPSAPQATALNAGHVQRFPRINGWVLIPSEVGYLVGTVNWIGIERSAFPQKARGDRTLVDLPYPDRRMTVTPLGTLRWRGDAPGERPELLRGILSYPSVGEAVLVPSADQSQTIAQGDVEAHVVIGSSPLAGDVNVRVDPDKLFGRHLAILGNTGSGKSCTVSGLIRWCLEAAWAERVEGEGQQQAVAPNARFVVLDPNGEYEHAFGDLPNTRVLNIAVDAQDGPGVKALKVPAWMWNSDEWASVLSARPGVQRPVLHEALRTLRGGANVASTTEDTADRLVEGYYRRLREMSQAGLVGFQGWPGNLNFGSALDLCYSDLSSVDISHLGSAGASLLEALHQVAGAQRYMTNQGATRYKDFSAVQVGTVMAAYESVVEGLPGDVGPTGGVNIDAPIPFGDRDLAAQLEFLSSDTRYSGNVQHIAPMTVRLRSILNDERINSVIATEGSESLDSWLSQFLGGSAEGGSVTVINLSLVPSDVLHICVSVIARLIFEAQQRYKKHYLTELPTVLVLEEAHTFVSAYSVDVDAPTPRYMCRSVFERIAREGRKFGLSLVLSSQRPSELSPTVLAQCNSFLLHRLVNDADQALVKRLVPDALGDLLNELPSLPSRQAILLGWAALLPTLVQIRELPFEHRPRSSDPQFWDVWRGAGDRPTDWEPVLDKWLR